MKYVFLVILSLINHFLCAQEFDEDVITEDLIEPVLWVDPEETTPFFKECESSDKNQQDKCTETKLFDFLMTNLVYPKEAIECGYEGKVWVELEVLETGGIGKVNVLKGIHRSLDNPAVEVFRMLPKFQPGTLRGQPIKTKLIVPIKFHLR